MPQSTYLKKKRFHLLEGTMNVFEELKRSKMEETAQYFEKQFFITDLRFLLPFQNFIPHIEIMKLWKNHWSLMDSDDVP
jgi:hypothetical protein